MKTIKTILGDISPNDAGITLPHEHLLFDQRCYLEDEVQLEQKRRFHEPVTLENRGEVGYYPFSFPDNLLMDDIEVAIEEAFAFKRAGGGTIVELSPPQFGRDPGAFYDLAVATGLNIVFGASNYIERFWTEEQKKRTAEDIRAEIVGEFLDGIGTLKLKPGIIGEVALSSIHNENEIKSLKGAAYAQKEIGCPLNIHPPLFKDGGHAKDGHAVLDIIESCGGNLNQTTISHCDLVYDSFDYLDSMAKRGAYIEFDLFGGHIMQFRSRPSGYSICDLERVKAIGEQIKRGNIERILISNDICFKHKLKKWGGFGYAHIIQHIMPMMKYYGGFSEEDIRTIVIENPKRYLSW